MTKKLASYSDMRDISMLFLATGPLLFCIGYVSELSFGLRYGAIAGFSTMIGLLVCSLAVSWSYWNRKQKEQTQL
jgi:hypothetical protein